ncbi:hypothetical protein ABZX77_30465 [Streptomyces sp. NPDC004237]|uniref:hypothetical protein n=1 Tax=Streptomyces sp. NPDC004237 TaxID=3154455 RepID=UPI0033A08D0F
MKQPRLLRPTVLFGKHFVWVRLHDGRLALYPDPLCRPRARPGMTSKTVTVTVSTELAEAFEAHLHLLAPAVLVGKALATDPLRYVYCLHHPSPPPRAASVTPVYQRSADGSVSLLSLDWYDARGRALPAPPADGPAQ